MKPNCIVFFKSKAFIGCILIASSIIFSCNQSPEKLLREQGWFEFVMSDLDTGLTVIDMSFLNEIPAGKSGYISVKNGHFADGAGQKIRFFGTNVTFSSCFPEKEISERIAVRMKKLGYNVVRFHHWICAVPHRGSGMKN